MPTSIRTHAFLKSKNCRVPAGSHLEQCVHEIDEVMPNQQKGVSHKLVNDQACRLYHLDLSRAGGVMPQYPPFPWAQARSCSSE